MSDPSTPASPTAASDESVPLDSIFLTGPGGCVYEVPRAVAEQYVLRVARMRELGHLPITPYDARMPASTGSRDGDDVQARNMVMLPSGTMGWHSDVQYGTYRFTDGQYYTGNHYHPFMNELGYPA